MNTLPQRAPLLRAHGRGSQHCRELHHRSTSSIAAKGRTSEGHAATLRAAPLCEGHTAKGHTAKGLTAEGYTTEGHTAKGRMITPRATPPHQGPHRREGSAGLAPLEPHCQQPRRNCTHPLDDVVVHPSGTVTPTPTTTAAANVVSLLENRLRTSMERQRVPPQPRSAPSRYIHGVVNQLKLSASSATAL